MTFVAPPAANKGRGPKTVRLSVGDGVSDANKESAPIKKIDEIRMSFFI